MELIYVLSTALCPLATTSSRHSRAPRMHNVAFLLLPANRIIRRVKTRNSKNENYNNKNTGGV